MTKADHKQVVKLVFDVYQAWEAVQGLYEFSKYILKGTESSGLARQIQLQLGPSLELISPVTSPNQNKIMDSNANLAPKMQKRATTTSEA